MTPERGKHILYKTIIVLRIILHKHSLTHQDKQPLLDHLFSKGRRHLLSATVFGRIIDLLYTP